MESLANITTRTYTLTLSPDYVKSWGFWEAVRELLQNSIDQRAVSSESMKVFDYTDGTLTIGNTNCRLGLNTLLMGVSNKFAVRGGTAMLGQFGEGYKLALLVLTRLLWDVRILNNDTVWTPRFEYSSEFNSYVLQIDVAPAENLVDGVFFVIKNVEQEHFDAVAENYLGDAPQNVILEDDHLRKRVFVGGLFVCEIEALRYGYNFEPGRIALDRDRRLAKTFDVSWEASRIWEQHGDTGKLYNALEAGVADVAYVTCPTGEVKNAIIQRYLAEHPDAVPVASQREADSHHKSHFVPESLRNLLHGMHNFFVFEPGDSPAKLLEAFYYKHSGHNWEFSQRSDWKELMEKAKEWR